jgi:hypothetical protein
VGYCFDGQFYRQTDGVAVGSPLSPVITIFFMEDFEKKAIEQSAHKTISWFKYVDDTFIIWPHCQEKRTEFLNHLSGLHNNIGTIPYTLNCGHTSYLLAYEDGTDSMHDYPLYFVCPDLLITVGETSYGI